MYRTPAAVIRSLTLPRTFPRPHRQPVVHQAQTSFHPPPDRDWDNRLYAPLPGRRPICKFLPRLEKAIRKALTRQRLRQGTFFGPRSTSPDVQRKYHRLCCSRELLGATSWCAGKKRRSRERSKGRQKIPPRVFILYYHIPPCSSFRLCRCLECGPRCAAAGRIQVIAVDIHGGIRHAERVIGARCKSRRRDDRDLIAVLRV